MNSDTVHKSSQKNEQDFSTLPQNTVLLRKISCTLCVLEIMAPQWSNLILTADVPNCETYILVLHSFNIKTLNTKQKPNISILFSSANIGETDLSHLPIVGMVVTISPSFSLYRIVVFPAASRPTIRILISFLPKTLKRFANMLPMFERCLFHSSETQQDKNLIKKHHPPTTQTYTPAKHIQDNKVATFLFLTQVHT